MPRPAVIHDQQPVIAVVVAVAHAPVEHVGHGFKPAVRVVGKAADVVVGVLGTKFVQHQKWVKVGQRAAADHPGQLDPGPVRSRQAAHAAGDARLGNARVGVLELDCGGNGIHGQTP